ncbi:MAG: radical SAM/SPASM domain-containing protein [Thermoanaerobaculia bacterium]
MSASASCPTLTRPRGLPSEHAAHKNEAVESFRRFARGQGLPEYPIEIFLEVSNVCDLRCVMCPRFSALNPDRKTAIQEVGPGFMKPEPVTASLTPLLSRALVVHAFGYGEPTIHPDFADVLEHLSQYDVLLDFFTNGMHLTEDLVGQLVRLAVHHITISFSGATREHYESVYQGGDFDRVLTGLARLRDAKRAAGTVYPRVHINSLSFNHHMRALDQFVVLMAEHGVERVEVTRLLEHSTILPEMAGHAADMRSPEVRAALARACVEAERRGVRLDLTGALLSELALPERRAQAQKPAPPVPIETLTDVARGLPVYPPAPGGPPPIPVLDLEGDSPNEMRARMAISSVAPDVPGERPFVCLEPFKTMYVRKGGQVKSCCYMMDNAPMLGDVTRTGAEEIWRGRGFAIMRAAILNGEYPMRACGSCLENKQAPPSHGVDRMLEDYAAWHTAAFGADFPRTAMSDLMAAPDGRTVAERLFALRPDCFEAPGAREREAKLATLVEDVSRLDGVPSALYEGWVDAVAGRGVAGWLWSPLYPDLRLTVTVDVDGRTIGTAVARVYRPDLAASGKGDGRYGFSLDLGDDTAIRPGQAVRVRVGDTRCQIQGVPARHAAP